MDSAATQQRLDGAFDAIEGSILPTLSILLDNLLDAAALAVPGLDAECHAADLRRLSEQLGDLGWRIESVAPAAVHAPTRLRMSA